MGTCELCGFEGIATRRATVRGTLLECCTKCIDSMGLAVESRIVKLPKSNPESRVLGKGVSGVDIMTKEEMELAPDFHSRIRKAREISGLSQSELASSMNLKVSAIQKAENGIRPTDSILEKISKSLGIKLFVEAAPRNSRVVESSSHSEMTISDAVTEIGTGNMDKAPRKKARRLGVSRKGARNRR
ncbi:MAG: helix-turn-helix domain-containing protein [Candidatus Thalassarchaeaceae archaeon]|nr:helix-turn-helix domain-containing protein [Candidatus Thalassarchaeaceae archaeon]MEE2630072.1 helix-turn-helix domain-containing protein [Candidatus Thermoplasmatota archaeon]